MTALSLQTVAKVQQRQYLRLQMEKNYLCKFMDSLWEDITSNYGMLDENRAVMEMAAASGLPLVPEEKRDPRYTTSYGTGEMIADALRRGFRIYP